MKPQATRETLEALAEALDTADTREPLPLGPRVRDRLSKYRAAIRPPIRTRQEVDAEIAETVRQHGPLPDTKHGAIWEIRGIFPERLMALCAEPTREPEAELPWDCPNCRIKP